MVRPLSPRVCCSDTRFYAQSHTAGQNVVLQGRSEYSHALPRTCVRLVFLQ